MDPRNLTGVRAHFQAKLAGLWNSASAFRGLPSSMDKATSPLAEQFFGQGIISKSENINFMAPG
jgi:hypothetical protein